MAMSIPIPLAGAPLRMEAPIPVTTPQTVVMAMVAVESNSEKVLKRHFHKFLAKSVYIMFQIA